MTAGAAHGGASAPPWVGVMLPVQDFGGGFEATFEMARESERLGLDSVWLGDHLSFRQPIVEAIVAAATVAATTERIAIGFGVLQLAMRHPVWLAKQLGTLCHLASERIEVGAGIGGENPAEWRAVGVPRAQRAARTAELMEVLPALLAGEPVSHHGAHYSFDAPALLPAPRRVPRLWMGGRSEGALRRAGELADGWLGLWIDEERLRSSSRQMAAIARDAGRPAPVSALVVPVVVEEDPARAAACFERFTKLQYGGEYERFARWCVGGTVEQIAARLDRLRAAGASGFVLMSAAREPLGELEDLARVRALLHG